MNREPPAMITDGLAQRLDRGTRTAKLGLLVNTLLAVIKLLAGIFGHSYALIADAIESSGDVFSSIFVWRGLSVSARSPDERYPFGYGKAEPMAAAAVGLMLVVAAGLITFESIQRDPRAAPSAGAVHPDRSPRCGRGQGDPLPFGARRRCEGPERRGARRRLASSFGRHHLGCGGGGHHGGVVDEDPAGRRLGGAGGGGGDRLQWGADPAAGARGVDGSRAGAGGDRAHLWRGSCGLRGAGDRKSSASAAPAFRSTSTSMCRPIRRCRCTRRTFSPAG